MKTYHKDFGITASITDLSDGTARLTARAQYGKKVHDKVHSSRKAAESAWRRMCR
ncbi:hypothetical protein KL86CLO1_10810 [uncultured Eubacteriales bacterium]|uniref:Uncharacterized protein n=1 Tax=uncultured Eubacteriales bacterium TaxID=172733 RepID=A0A212JBA8_9FIRM|nr:hypothetical protein KL86CLO1_10810 [uncultured Eubacteriales bacterium]